MQYINKYGAKRWVKTFGLFVKIQSLTFNMFRFLKLLICIFFLII